ncbi:MAG: hypothetical protein RLZZ208_709, partial [Actinomycetota bacterium]
TRAETGAEELFTLLSLEELAPRRSFREDFAMLFGWSD